MKTIAVRLDDDKHAQAVLAADAAGETLTDLIRRAIDNEVARLVADDSFRVKAELAIGAAEDELAARKTALASLLTVTPGA